MKSVWVLQFRKGSAAYHSAWLNKRDMLAYIKKRGLTKTAFRIKVNLYEDGDLKQMGIKAPTKKRRRYSDVCNRSEKRKRRSSEDD